MTLIKSNTAVSSIYPLWVNTAPPLAPQLDGLTVAPMELALAAMPAGHTHHGALILAGCRMEYLPSNLTVLGDLILIGCQNLKKLPHGLNVRGTINTTGCSSLAEIPGDITCAGFDDTFGGISDIWSKLDRKTRRRMMKKYGIKMIPF